jgi:hypothetical protein
MFRIELAFGHHRRDGVPLRPHRIAEAERQFLGYFIEVFGGAQVYICYRVGGYPNDDGQPEAENCTFMWAFVEAVEEHLVDLRCQAAAIAAMLEQQSVMLAVERIDGWCEFIEPSTNEL